MVGPIDLVCTVGGALLGLGGAAVLFSAVSYLIRRGGGTPLSFVPPKRMVVSGPYAHIQHPMLLGVFCLGLGAAAWFRSPGLGLASAAFALVAHLFVVLREEPVLKKRFGEDYEAYQAATPRWFPCSLAHARIQRRLFPRRDKEGV
jgi:protein-S-isoprenylcysteine O-methyltransferase Ste14